MRRKAFTLIELMVAMAILAIVLAMAGAIFKVAIQSYRVATANAEIMRKFRTITEQLDRDFQGLRKDCEIVVVWDAKADPSVQDTEAGYARFDRIMFFATGDFESYGFGSAFTTPIEGNLARISYSLARRYHTDMDTYKAPTALAPRERILARTQHIMTPEPKTGDVNVLDPKNDPVKDPDLYRTWHNRCQHDQMTLLDWRRMSSDRKLYLLSQIADVNVVVGGKTYEFPAESRGAYVDPCDPNSLHLLLCEGVGQFAIQGWYGPQQRYVPQVDPCALGKLDPTKSDFIDSNGTETPGLWYTDDPCGVCTLGEACPPYSGPFDQGHFSQVPGLGRALQFTFTLYDSKGIIKSGRTFSHTVYLDR